MENKIDPSYDPAPGSYLRWAIILLGSINFILSMFYRASTTVIAPALIRDFGMTASQLSDLSAAFFYSFAASQLPVGFAMDKWGTRATLGILAVIGLGGGLLFSEGTTSQQLLLGRLLLGIGMSGNLMLVLALIAAWFPVRRFAFLSGSVVAFGIIGNLLAATPLALLSLSVGWRSAFLIFTLIDAVVVSAFFIIIKERPGPRVVAQVQSEPKLLGLRRLFSMYDYWAISLANFVRYGYFGALQSLWVGPFLMFGLGLDEISASNALFLMGLGYMIGLPVSGYISDRVLKSRKKVVFWTMSAMCLIVLSMTSWTSDVSFWVVGGTLMLMGITASPGQILYAHMKELLPTSMLAQAVTAVNLFTVLGAGIMTHILGLIVGGDPSGLKSPQEFGNLWYFGAAALAVACLLYARVPDSRILGEMPSVLPEKR